MAHNRARKLKQTSVVLVLLTLFSWITTLSAFAASPVWAKSATLYEVNVRQYSAAGNFDGVTSSLPRLKKLGVGILWLMPIQPISVEKRKGLLGSPYSVADYKGINPEFGDAAALHRLINSAHALGLKVVFDWVANHSGWDNPWIKNKNWYHQNRVGEIISPNSDWIDVAWLNYENQEMRGAMLEAMKYWVTEFDIDGYRADVAGGVPVDFWESANGELQKIKPLFMLAEEQGTPNMLDKAFVANYNWNLLNDLNSIAQDQMGVVGYLDNYNYRMKKYPVGTFPLNFITNHDENSWNGSEYKRMGAAVNAMAALSFTLPGMPLIYSGQEVGNTKELAFFEKDLIPNLDFENSTTAFYKKLVALKSKNPALWNDAPLKVDEIKNKSLQIIAFYRVVGKNKVLVIVNASNKSQKLNLDFKALAGIYKQFSTEKSVTLGKTQTITLKPWGFEIYSNILK